MSLDTLFNSVVKNKASDLHLVVGMSPLLRIDGVLMPIAKTGALTLKIAKELISSILSRGQEEKFLKEKELDFAHQTKNGSRFRINLHFEKGHPSMAARLIPAKIPTMEEIAMPKIAYEMARKPHGLILVTGPTGSGKSTTLAAMVDLVNKERSLNIITMEDPVEFLFKPNKCIVRQRQIGLDSLSFGEAMRRVLRQDPDVIMVGEMRDLETIATTLTLAETGHLVFATLHTWSAAQTIDRIIDSFPSHQQTQIRLQLALTLRGIISQQLLPKIGGGRVAAREILVNNPASANLIRENKVSQINTVIETNAKFGMTSLHQDLQRLVKLKQIDKATADAFVVSGIGK
ncbi:MAG: PilT/PilU family type 4a pilus ATPase [Patescibacteria group bacterium]|nr:PilT/PilU family type 4a pilus ATPase [Patescibacteria group bacterium]